MSQPTKSNNNLLYIDGLRAIAAVYVVMHHAMLHYKLDFNQLDFLHKLGFTTLAFGHYMVDLFIVISGFSLMLPAIKRNYDIINIWDFYKRRLRRILPPYYISIALSLLLIYFFIGFSTHTLWDIAIPVNNTSIITHLLLIHDLFLSQAHKINFAFWSISVESRIYIFFPLLLILWKKAGPISALLFTIGLSVFILVVLSFLKTLYPDISLESGVNPYIILFAMGMLAADISFSSSAFSKKASKLPWGILMIASFVLFLALKKLIIVLHINLNQDIQNEFADIIFGMMCFCLFIICSHSKYDNSPLRILKTIFSWKPMVFVGMFAYSIYLIHPPLLQLLSVYVMPLLNLSPLNATVVLILIGTPFIIFISYLFFLLFEKPFLNKRKNETLIQTEINAVNNPAP